MNLIVILIVLVSLLLMLVILAQNSKGGGLSSQFGGSGASQLMGVKRTGDLLEKVTWGLAITLIALTLSTNFFMDTTRRAGVVSPNIQRAQEQQVVPGFGGTQVEPEDGMDRPGRETDQDAVYGIDLSDDTTRTEID